MEYSELLSNGVLELLFQELQADILKTGKTDFQFITLRPKAGLKRSCFYFRTRSCLNSKTRVIGHGRFDELGKNRGGMTPVHYAAQNGYANIVRLLEQHGADIDAVTDCGRSEFMLAAENGHKDVLAFVYCINESSLSTPKEKHVQSLSQ